MEKWSELGNECRQLGFGAWIETWDIKHIYEEVSNLSAGQVYLEVGTARGQSLAIATLAAKTIEVEVCGIDLIDWPDRDKNIANLLTLKGEIGLFRFIQGDSQEIAKAWDKPIDVLFIDGDHTYLGVVKDMVSWLPHVRQGGVIMFDDYNMRTGVYQAINDVLKYHKAYTDHEVDNEMYLCKKKLL